MYLQAIQVILLHAQVQEQLFQMNSKPGDLVLLVPQKLKQI